MYKGFSIRLWEDYSAGTWHARRQWDDIFKVLKEKNMPTEKSIYGKKFFKNGEIKTFLDKQKLKEFIIIGLQYNKC